jgi:hypothetical protein
MYVLSERFGNFIRRILGSKPNEDHHEDETKISDKPNAEEGAVRN